VNMIVVFVETMDLDDVRVSAEDVEDFGFFLEALAVSWIGEEAFVDGFAGESVAGDGGVAAVDDAEAASADLVGELIIVVYKFLHVCLDGG